MDNVDFQRRFMGVSRLYGDRAFRNFQEAHVCIVGVGGVGSWVAESLARSAVGKLTLIDLDHVAESNINRQIQALSSTLGLAKVAVLKKRIEEINPFCEVKVIEDFVSDSNLSTLIPKEGVHYVVDAIDQVKNKAALLAYCYHESIQVVTIGGAGGKMDPGKILIRDLLCTEQDPLLSNVKRRLRKSHGLFRGKKKCGMTAVFSLEPVTQPIVCAVHETHIAPLTGLNCAGLGAIVAVTATFGMHASAWVLRQLATKQ